ncbi:unnamed protein product [Candidula unifasciata]|uniref:Uncharacterized protein n=1 Tax=Candidula unifasciata TaxID=100452 RepID=A0A8S3YUP9_9EUPU|nr:unnamed protein product [Candidula unifasciata]
MLLDGLTKCVNICAYYSSSHRRFAIVKKTYLSLKGVTSSEMNAVLRWSDLVSLPDASTFLTQRVSWNVMEEHLTALANSDNKSLVLLAARICMESLARNQASYISSIVNLGGISQLIRLGDTRDILLKKRVYACLEVMSRYDPAQRHLIDEGILAQAVRHLQDCNSPELQLSCLFILNSLCSNRNTLLNILAVDNYLVITAAMQMLTDSAKNTPGLDHSHSWCTLPRQNLILLCKLCVDGEMKTLT